MCVRGWADRRGSPADLALSAWSVCLVDPEGVPEELDGTEDFAVNFQRGEHTGRLYRHRFGLVALPLAHLGHRDVERGQGCRKAKLLKLKCFLDLLKNRFSSAVRCQAIADLAIEPTKLD